MKRFWKKGCAVAVSLAMVIAPVSAYATENADGDYADETSIANEMDANQEDAAVEENQGSSGDEFGIITEDTDTSGQSDQMAVPEGVYEDAEMNGENTDLAEDENSESDLTDAEEDFEDAEEPEEDADENAIATLAVTNGFGQGEDGNWYYYVDGQISTGTNSVIQGTVNGTNAWWYVVGGQVQLKFTGLADYANENGWWYIEKGKVNFDIDTIAQNKNGWFYVKDGKVDFSFTGLADFPNENGWWYIENGKVTFSKNTIAQNKNGWYYVKGSKVDFNFTGLADFPNENGWWYCEKGKVTFSKNTIAQNKNGWFYVKGSKVDFNFTGLADFPNENGWWYCEKGKVTFSKNTIAQNKNGWWYVKGSKVDFNFTGLADFSNENGWWYCEGGQVKFNHTGVEQNKNGWFYVKDSKVDFSYTGIAQNKNGWWYIEGGKVLFNDLMTSAANYLGAHTSSSLSNAERLKACSNYMYNHYNFESTNGIPTAASLNSYAEYFFKYDTGACYHHTAGLACMAKALGFDTIFHEGYISDDTYGMMMHSWCEVYVNGQWLIYDPGQGYAAQKESDIDRVFETRNAYRLTISNGETVWTKV